MPKRRRTTATNNNRYRKRKSAYGRPSRKFVDYRPRIQMRNIGTGRQGMAPQCKTTLVYYDRILLTGALNTIALQRMNLNGCYKPDYDNAGHQPRFWDQVSSTYSRYLVDSCSYEVIFSPSSTTGTFICGVVPSNAPAPTFNNNWPEFPLAKHKEFPFTTEANLDRTFRGRVYLPDLHGQTYSEFKNDDNNEALTNTIPVNAAILHILCNNTQSTYSCIVSIKLTYKVTLYDPVTPFQS